MLTRLHFHSDIIDREARLQARNFTPYNPIIDQVDFYIFVPLYRLLSRGIHLCKDKLKYAY